MVALRFLGIAFLALCAFAGAFLLAFAAILCGWIVYADYSGALGSTDGSEAAFALFWAPLGALLAGLLAAGSVFRMRGARTLQKGAAIGGAGPAPPEENADSDLARRLGEHADLLKQLQAITAEASQAPRGAASTRQKLIQVQQEHRRVA